MLVFAEDGKWKCCLSDREEGYYAFLSSDGLESLLAAANEGLRKGGLDWRASKGKR